MLRLYEPLIERLKARVKEVDGDVRAIGAIGEVSQDGRATDALFVLYDGYSPVDTAAHGMVVADVRYIVVARVRGSHGDAQDGVVRAHRLTSAVLAALCGWGTEVEGCRPLALASAPRPGVHQGNTYIPLGFAGRVTVPAPKEKT